MEWLKNSKRKGIKPFLTPPPVPNVNPTDSFWRGTFGRVGSVLINRDTRSTQHHFFGKKSGAGSTSPIIIIAIILVVLLLITLELFLNPIEETIPQATAIINSYTINLEVVTTQIQQNKGLSDRPSLPPDHGMLFIFEGYQNQSFWMKDMQFSIDIIWVKDNIVVGLSKNLPIPTDAPLPIYSPPEPINFVLELNSGAADKYNIRSGDKIKFNLHGKQEIISLDQAQSVKQRHENTLIDIPGVVGAGLSQDSKGSAFIEVYTLSFTPEMLQTIPKELEGIPVKILETGPFELR